MRLPLLSTTPNSRLWQIGSATVAELECDQGLLASSKEEIYGCVFGRDSLISSLKLLRVSRQTGRKEYLGIVERVLTNLVQQQGKTINIESGEQPGKCIHEYRLTRHEHLTRHPVRPWFLYPDGAMRNYDSLDSTPLFLITLYRYCQQRRSPETFSRFEPAVRAGFDWLLRYGDANGDGFFDYQLHPDRRGGGLITQSWMDSQESVFLETGQPAAYPIAPVEVQAYAYLSMKLWLKYFSGRDSLFAAELANRADQLRTSFNRAFMIEDEGGFSIAAGIDGLGRQLRSARSSMGHLLWAALNPIEDGTRDAILEPQYIPRLVQRLMAKDLFEPAAGFRTLSTRSVSYQPNSYHNGSIWPHDTSLVAEGLDHFGYRHQAARARRALLQALHHFGTPIELFVYDQNGYAEYQSPSGQAACRKQAWSAAAMLSDVAAWRSDPLRWIRWRPRLEFGSLANLLQSRP